LELIKDIKIEKSWKSVLKDDLKSASMNKLSSFLSKELKKKSIYPAPKEIFAAFNQTPFDKVKVVIIGQDPYHGEGQAHGMCFSVKKGVKIPPSLRNIYKELSSDLDLEIPEHGNLSSWASEGVLLLNAVLTVEHSKAGSHHGRGWEEFTDSVIEYLNNEKENLVFILWGAPAQKKARKVDESKHLVLKSPHPSPLAAYRGFFGNHHFSKTNEYLKSKGIAEVDWSLK
jgi:uracil-DNA glycosylase